MKTRKARSAKRPDAGAASLKKVPTQMLRERIAAILRTLDGHVHLAKLEVQNQRYAIAWPPVALIVETVANLELVARELRSRPKWE